MIKHLVHIGFPKTATTWLQEEFFPRVKNINYIDKHIVNELFANPDAFSFSAANVAQRLEKLDMQGGFLMSSELLVGTMNRGWLRGFWPTQNAQRIKECIPNAQIIIFLRNQPDLIASAYLQYVKNGGNYSVSRYLNSSNYNLFSFDHLNFLNIVGLYASLFGKENVHVYLYEDFVANKQAFLHQFCSEFDLDVDFSNVNLEPINTGLRVGLVLPKRIANAFYYKMFPFKHYLFPIYKWNVIQSFVFDYLNRLSFFGKRPKSKDLLGQKNYEFILNYYKESNRTLMEQFGLHAMSRYNYPL